jgi:hypothetical protein
MLNEVFTKPTICHYTRLTQVSSWNFFCKHLLLLIIVMSLSIVPTISGDYRGVGNQVLCYGEFELVQIYTWKSTFAANLTIHGFLRHS